MAVKKNIKDSMFRSIFKERKELIQLYTAITGEAVADLNSVVLNTLSTVLANRMHNDLSFSVNNKFTVLIEAQSTKSGNMPLRMLLYLGLLYNKLVPKEVRYKENAYPLPQPQFYVIYDGRDTLPDDFVQHLSEAFIEKLPDTAPSMDLDVRWINITNPDAHLCQRCSTLRQYSQFLERLRYNERLMQNHEEAVRKTIQECIKMGILREYLLSHEEEVFTMFDSEWDYDTAIRVAKEEAAENASKETAAATTTNIVLNLLRANTPLQFIIKGTHLTADAIRQIAARNGLTVVES